MARLHIYTHRNKIYAQWRSMMVFLTTLISQTQLSEKEKTTQLFMLINLPLLRDCVQFDLAPRAANMPCSVSVEIGKKSFLPSVALRRMKNT